MSKQTPPPRTLTHILNHLPGVVQLFGQGSVGFRLNGEELREVVEEKIAEWLNAGVRVALLVDPTSETVTVHRGPTDVEVLHSGDVFSGTDVIPGWQLDVAQVFETTR